MTKKFFFVASGFLDSRDSFFNTSMHTQIHFFLVKKKRNTIMILKKMCFKSAVKVLFHQRLIKMSNAFLRNNREMVTFHIHRDETK